MAEPRGPDEAIYHVCRRADWQAARESGRHPGSRDDLRDGFIHCSSAAQLADSVARHRAGESDLVLLEIDPAPLGAALRWEASRGGALFPHIHGELPLVAVRAAWPLSLGADGAHRFPAFRLPLAAPAAPPRPASIATSLLRLLPPEWAHRAAILALKLGLAPRARAPLDPVLRCRVFGLDFANPLGLAAGFDKSAEAVGPLAALGFGFVEIGSVTPRPQAGNPKPRLFRLAEDRALINRMGFNNDGLAAVERRLAARPRGLGVLGVNLGKNKDSAEAAADYAAGARALARHADYLVINVSSPNTPGLRLLQDRAPLERLVAAVRAALAAAAPERSPPLLLKIAPDLAYDDADDVVAVALAEGLDGLVIGNTTVSRPAGLRSPHRGEAGGLSGRPLFPLALAMLAHVYRRSAGRLPIIGVGGVASAADAYAMIRAGASLVQLYTALVYRGPGLVAEIAAGLAALLRADGFAAVSQAVGADAR
jgi:dihydroorotate dehydrogenase